MFKLVDAGQPVFKFSLYVHEPHFLRTPVMPKEARPLIVSLGLCGEYAGRSNCSRLRVTFPLTSVPIR